MQPPRKKADKLSTLALLVALVFSAGALGAQTQDAVSFLRASHQNNDRERVTVVGVQDFSFERNLIFFTAHLDGKAGNYILDTGAPTLLLNARDQAVATSAYGIAAGGTVALADYPVESFKMAGRDLGKQWALAMDLRPMESRTGKTIDGYVGYDLLRSGELRINYEAESFYLRKSTRKPRHEGKLPDHVFRFSFHDHLPVITLKVNGKKLRFAIDTGAGVNLLDEKVAHTSRLAAQGNDRINIQGLDGGEAIYDVVQLHLPAGLPDSDEAIRCVAMALDHLQSPGQPLLSGILGSSFLSSYTVGIDYRRRKLYLWNSQVKH